MLNAATPGQTTHKGLAAFMAAASAVAGLVSLAVWRRRLVGARVAAASAVTAVL